MNDLEVRFQNEMSKRILLLWNLNNRDQCTSVDIATQNFSKLIYENKEPQFDYTIKLTDGSAIREDQINTSFKSFVKYLSSKTLESLTSNEIS